MADLEGPSLRLLRARAREMRLNPTHAERELWYMLRKRRIHGRRFRRQFVLRPYIVDFFCHEVRLAIELDGQAHGGRRQGERDRTRQRWIEEHHGVWFLRFTNEQVLEEPGVVRSVISAAVKEGREG